MTISELIELLELKRHEAGEDAETNIVTCWWGDDGELVLS